MYGKNKKYLSYSAINTWLTRPAEYRKRYYQLSEFQMTPELTFGKKIADELEDPKNEIDIKQYSHPEYKLELNIEGVPIFGFIDSFEPDTFAFLEFKTGRHPWNKKRVDKHLQLDLYSLCIQELFGQVQDECELIWMETQKKEKDVTGLSTDGFTYDIELTGRVETFPRVITQKDRDEMRDLIVRVSNEIREDYHTWCNKDCGLTPA